MNSIAIAAAITLFAANSALAGPKQSRVDRTKLQNAQAMTIDTSSHDVYVGGRLIGRDPDPNIRQSLRDSYFTYMGR